MDPAEKLRKMGLDVRAFTTYHFRVEGQIDFWLPRGRWHDLVLGDRGQKPLDQIPYFIKARLEQRPAEVPKEIFVERLVEIGYSKEEAEKAWNARELHRTS